jgi:hypothetical protein
MIQRIPLFRPLAASLIFVLTASGVPVLAQVDSGAVRGSVITLADQQPLAGARVHVADPHTGEVFSSAPVTERGDFAVEGLPPSTYELAVESQGGLYVIDSAVAVQAGEARDVTLAVNAQQVAPDPATAEQQKKKKRAGVWNNPLTAALIVVGSAIVIGLVIDSATDDDDDEPEASPSS